MAAATSPRRRARLPSPRGAKALSGSSSCARRIALASFVVAAQPLEGLRQPQVCRGIVVLDGERATVELDRALERRRLEQRGVEVGPAKLPRVESRRALVRRLGRDVQAVGIERHPVASPSLAVVRLRHHRRHDARGSPAPPRARRRRVGAPRSTARGARQAGDRRAPMRRRRTRCAHAPSRASKRSAGPAGDMADP